MKIDHNLHEVTTSRKKRLKALNRKSSLLKPHTVYSKPSAISSVDKSKCRNWTLSIAFPGSILNNVQTAELKTYMIGQIARSAAIFKVDEIVIYEESLSEIPEDTINEPFKGADKKSDPNVFMSRILQYLETPQYLRKALFPIHPDLKYAGLLNPLDAPHHLRLNDQSIYREGIVLAKPLKSKDVGSFVDVGLEKPVQIDHKLKEKTRVTVKFRENELLFPAKGTAVSSKHPKHENGLYWGYDVRLASGLTCMVDQCPYEGGYDLVIGTSERGDSDIQDVMPSFRHALVVFGGLGGIETALEYEKSRCGDMENIDPRKKFNVWMNSCPSQGSRTIRTEVFDK